MIQEPKSESNIYLQDYQILPDEVIITISIPINSDKSEDSILSKKPTDISEEIWSDDVY